MMRPTRRNLLRYGAAAAASSLAAPAIADTWPSKPIKIVCTYPPGGLTDVLRALTESMSRKSSASRWW